MARRYGRTFRGQRLVAKVPHGHWKTTTFVGALRATGITAPLVIDGPMNGDIFLAYVQQQLGPTLRSGDTVIMDNLSSHKRAGVREAIEAVGAKLVYLPPYSPDLNPIELAFSKLKAKLRQAATRTVADLESTIAQICNQFTHHICHVAQFTITTEGSQPSGAFSPQPQDSRSRSGRTRCTMPRMARSKSFNPRSVSAISVSRILNRPSTP